MLLISAMEPNVAVFVVVGSDFCSVLFHSTPFNCNNSLKHKSMSPINMHRHKSLYKIATDLSEKIILVFIFPLLILKITI